MIRKHLIAASAVLAFSAAACGEDSNSNSGAPTNDAGDAGATPTDPSKPTVVLVHGAFADASSWNGVVEGLQQRGYPVMALANPLRGVQSDGASIASVLKTVQGPIVLAGHSYGGMVISQAAQGIGNVKALVYIAAFVPEEGESAIQLDTQFPGAKLGPATTNVVPYTRADGGAGNDTYIKAESFRDVFAGDLSPRTTALMAATQRPIDGGALDAKLTGTPAWKSIPSWALVASADNAIPPEAERFMANRARAKVVEVNASHAVSVSQPDAVVNILLDAARTVVP